MHPFLRVIFVVGMVSSQRRSTAGLQSRGYGTAGRLLYCFMFNSYALVCTSAPPTWIGVLIDGHVIVQRRNTSLFDSH